MPWETPPSTVLSGHTLGVSRVYGSIATFFASDNVTLSGAAGKIVFLGAAGGTGGAGGGVAASAGSQSVSTGTIIFANSNGVTFGMSGSSQITATVRTDYLTTARASNDAIGLNTAQTNVVWTVNSSGLSIDARGYAGTATAATNATLTLNSAGLSISVAAPGAGAAPSWARFFNVAGG